MFLNSLLGSESAERVLLFLSVYQQGYASQISKIFDIPLSEIQKQLQKYERGGILVSRKIGKTRLYEWNPRYMFLNELKALLNKAIQNLPATVIEKYFRKRTRPRRTGKPL